MPLQRMPVLRVYNLAWTWRLDEQINVDACDMLQFLQAQSRLTPAQETCSAHQSAADDPPSTGETF